MVSAGVHETVSGRVDADGNLIAADPRLMALQLQAGGTKNGVLAVPSLATVARLAQSLGILVSRNVIAADGGDDLDLIVRAKPDGPDIILDIGGWVTQRSAQQRFGVAQNNQLAEIFWEADASLSVTRVYPDNALLTVGQFIDDVFLIEADDDGQLPLIRGLAARTAFAGQTARLEHEDQPIILGALPVYDSAQRFVGWRGRVELQSITSQAAIPARSAEPAVGAQRTSPNGFAHELNAALRPPLERIVAQADSIGMLTDGPIERDYINYAHDIAAAGRHLLGLVNDLTDVQTIESVDFRLDHDDVDLADLARRAANLLRVRAADCNVRIDAPPHDDVMIARGDFRRILQILVNLIGNAVRYSPPGSVVWVRTEQEGDLAALIVADQGKGIPGDAHDRIFEKFARLDTNEPGGTGLGLYISRKLARAMGGDISVDSAAGQGARFLLTLPTASPSHPVAPSS